MNQKREIKFKNKLTLKNTIKGKINNLSFDQSFTHTQLKKQLKLRYINLFANNFNVMLQPKFCKIIRNIEYNKNSTQRELLNLLRIKDTYSTKQIDNNDIICKFIEKLKENYNFQNLSKTHFIITESTLKNPINLINVLPISIKKYFVLELIKENSKGPQCIIHKLFESNNDVISILMNKKIKQFNLIDNWIYKYNLDFCSIRLSKYEKYRADVLVGLLLLKNKVNNIETALNLTNQLICLNPGPMNITIPLKYVGINTVLHLNNNNECVSHQEIPINTLIGIPQGHLITYQEFQNWIENTICERIISPKMYVMSNNSNEIESLLIVNHFNNGINKLLCNIKRTSNKKYNVDYIIITIGTVKLPILIAIKKISSNEILLRKEMSSDLKNKINFLQHQMKLFEDNKRLELRKNLNF